MKRLLIVEDDDLLARALARELSPLCSEVELASNVAAALAGLERSPNLLLVDVRLPDGNGIEVVERAARLVPKPKILALSAHANAEEGFTLAKAGACAYLPKPISLDTVLQAIERVLTNPVGVRPAIADLVGTVKFEQVSDEVKRVMIEQALGMTTNNITHAAELLGVSRQRMQHWLRTLGVELPD